MITATLTSKGQITIPKEIREKLSLRAGDRVTFLPTADGGVILRTKKLPFERLVGMLGRSACSPVTVEDMDAGIARRMRKKFPKT